MKSFTITGKCYPEKNYMVDISGRLEEMARMVGRGEYFTVNRGRQYGKTTVLSLLEKYLKKNYVVYFISFEGFGADAFQSNQRFARTFMDALEFAETAMDEDDDSVERKKLIREYLAEINHEKEFRLQSFSRMITRLCTLSPRPVVLMVDEVDQASGFASFIDFLAMLRAKFMERDRYATFYSVILASVYNIKNLKLKMRPDEQHRYNSPWNIASDFQVELSFSVGDISGMLAEYERDHRTGMDLARMAEMLFDYSGGYPYFVSKLCKIMDEKNNAGWDREGLLLAVNEVLSEENTLFDDMIKKLHDFPAMKEMFKNILYYGKHCPFVIDDPVVNIAAMFGYIRNEGGNVRIANRIFETRLYNLFVYEEGQSERIYGRER